MNLLLIGPPGSGKGTQGQRLAQREGWAHIATGDLLRTEVSEGTDLGRQVESIMARGDLVGDDLILEMVLPRVQAAAEAGGYVLDGFPRSLAQAQLALARINGSTARPDRVLYLDVPHEELVRRILERAAVEGRSDDTAEVVQNRLRVFDEATKPLIDYYRGRGLLTVVDGAQSADDVTRAVQAALDQVGHDRV